jgi:hypothetical protein
MGAKVTSVDVSDQQLTRQTSSSAMRSSADRLRFVTSPLRLDGQVAGWKLKIVSTGPVTVQ